jgi:hypothetical protein
MAMRTWWRARGGPVPASTAASPARAATSGRPYATVYANFSPEHLFSIEAVPLPANPGARRRTAEEELRTCPPDSTEPSPRSPSLPS